MTPPFWDVLGIEPTTDETAVRRAYAAKLRVTNPEDDGEAFKALRTAYEDALNHARYLRMVAEYEARNAEDNAEREQPGEADTADDSDTRQFDDEDPEDFQDPIAPAPQIIIAASTTPEAPSEHQQERDEHDERCRRFAQTFQSETPYEDRIAALNHVLKSPAMAQVDVYTATEQWLGHVLINGRPATDDLFDRVIGFFNWDEQLDLTPNALAQRVIYVRERMQAEDAASRILARIKDPRHEYNLAYRELLKPPSQRSWLSKRLAFTRGARVAEFLDYVDKRAPILFESMNLEAVDWWRKRAPKTQRERNIVGMLLIILFAGTFMSVPALNRMWDSAQPPTIAMGPRASEAPRGLQELLTEVRPVMTTALARRECTTSVRQLRQMSAAAHSPVLAKAEESCAEVIKRLPESLLMRQYAGIAALRARDAQAAFDHFDHILKFSPDDPYALYGKGLVSLLGDEGAAIADPKDMADALAMNADVKAYFDAFRLAAPGVEPTARKPRSRMPKREGVPYDKAPEQIQNPDAPDGKEIGAYFALPEDLAGEVLLNCLIGSNGELRDCVIASESIVNAGLGEIALYMSRWVRYKPGELEGVPVDGMPLRYTIQFSEKPPAE